MKRINSLHLAASLLLATLAHPVGAQICIGAPELGVMALGNVEGSVMFSDTETVYMLDGRVGSDLFGSLGLAYSDIANSDTSMKQVSAGIGYHVASDRQRLSLCPALNVGYAFGLEVLGLDFSSVSVAPSVAIGFATHLSSDISLIPFAQAALVHRRVTAEAEALPSSTQSETSGALTIGSGVGLGRRVVLRPALYIPVASENDDVRLRFGVAVAVGTGG